MDQYNTVLVKFQYFCIAETEYRIALCPSEDVFDVVMVVFVFAVVMVVVVVVVVTDIVVEFIVVFFIVACTRIYKPLCRSVSQSVRWSVGPSLIARSTQLTAIGLVLY